VVDFNPSIMMDNSSVGTIIHHIWKIKDVPNHQPEMDDFPYQYGFGMRNMDYII
jgi:CRISPR/Cas system endoribonuclease Cas6 (RAMP superfamily)